MTQQPQALPGDTLAWPWSITLANYDRSPVLTAAERAELDRIVGTTKRLVSPRMWILTIKFVFRSDNFSRNFSASACRAGVQERLRTAFLA
jgi:hypothetical protein